MITVSNIYDYLNKLAPFESQDKTDNTGLIVGNLNAAVKKVLVCLDVTNAVVAEAVEKDVDLIIAHHPLMYYGVKRIMHNDPVYALAANGISFIAVHTNLDIAKDGVTDLMLTRLDFPPSDVVIGGLKPGDTQFGKITELPTPISAKQLAERCKAAFGCTVVRYVDGKRAIKRVGVCSGGGSGLVELALEKGCDAYICGDLRWDRMIFADNYGLTLIDAGHFHTEDICCSDLVEKLQGKFTETDFSKSVNSIDVCSYC